MLLTPLEAAHVLRVQRRTIYQHIKHGRLPAHKIGSLMRIPLDALAPFGIDVAAVKAEIDARAERLMLR